MNTTTATQPFTVKNSGDAGYNLTVSSVAVGAANPEDWVVVFDKSTAIAPEAARNVRRSIPLIRHLHRSPPSRTRRAT